MPMPTVDTVYMLASGVEPNPYNRSIATLIETTESNYTSQLFITLETAPQFKDLPDPAWASYIAARAGNLTNLPMDPTGPPLLLETRDALAPEITKLLTQYGEKRFECARMSTRTELISAVTYHTPLKFGHPLVSHVTDYLGFANVDYGCNLRNRSEDSQSPLPAFLTGDEAISVDFYELQKLPGLESAVNEIFGANRGGSHFAEERAGLPAPPPEVVTVLAPNPHTLSNTILPCTFTIFRFADGSLGVAAEIPPATASFPMYDQELHLRRRIAIFGHSITPQIHACPDLPEAMSRIISAYGAPILRTEEGTRETAIHLSDGTSTRTLLGPDDGLARVFGRYFSYVKNTVDTPARSVAKFLDSAPQNHSRSSVDVYRLPPEHQEDLRNIIRNRTGYYSLDGSRTLLSFIAAPRFIELPSFIDAVVNPAPQPNSNSSRQMMRFRFPETPDPVGDERPDLITVLVSDPASLGSSQERILVNVFTAADGSPCLTCEMPLHSGALPASNPQLPLISRLERLRNLPTNNPTLRVYGFDDLAVKLSDLLASCGLPLVGSLAEGTISASHSNSTSPLNIPLSVDSPVARSLNRYLSGVDFFHGIQTLNPTDHLSSTSPDQLSPFVKTYKVPQELRLDLQNLIDSRTGEYFLSREDRNLTFIPEEDVAMIRLPIRPHSTTTQADA